MNAASRAVSLCSGFFVAVAVVGCQLEHPVSNVPNHPVWQVDLLPKLVCVNDTVRVKYRIANECPEGPYCRGFYPTIDVSSADDALSFPLSPYHNEAYSGEISSTPITAVAATNITVTSTPDLVWYRSDGTAMSDGELLPPGMLGLVSTPPVTLILDPIDSGTTMLHPISFNGMCAGSAPMWTAVSFETGQARSASVRIRRLCNRDARVVTFTAHFSSGLPDQDITLMPDGMAGGCVDIPSEAPPALITSLTARAMPGAEIVSCLDSSASAPPAPILAEVSMGCR